MNEISKRFIHTLFTYIVLIFLVTLSAFTCCKPFSTIRKKMRVRIITIVHAVCMVQYFFLKKNCPFELNLFICYIFFLRFYDECHALVKYSPDDASSVRFQLYTLFILRLCFNDFEALPWDIVLMCCFALRFSSQFNLQWFLWYLIAWSNTIKVTNTNEMTSSYMFFFSTNLWFVSFFYGQFKVNQMQWIPNKDKNE